MFFVHKNQFGCFMGKNQLWNYHTVVIMQDTQSQIVGTTFHRFTKTSSTGIFCSPLFIFLSLHWSRYLFSPWLAIRISSLFPSPNLSFFREISAVSSIQFTRWYVTFTPGSDRLQFQLHLRSCRCQRVPPAECCDTAVVVGYWDGIAQHWRRSRPLCFLSEWNLASLTS